jgi:acetyl-CoA decarbonylase/synthase complex subunit alpha
MPVDLHQFVRVEADVPFTMKEEILGIIKEKGWEEGRIGMLDPTLLERMVRRKS